MTRKIILAFLVAFGFHAWSAVTPLSVSIVPPVQFPGSDFEIAGLRASALWGRHRDVYGIDLGLVGNITDQDFVGLGVSGLFNWTKGSTTIIGLQAAGGFNLNTNKLTVVGLQLSPVNWNTASSSVSGLQVGLVNYSPHTNIYGLQVGIYNQAHEVYGLQIGIVNSAKSLHGIQIGLINLHHTGIVGVSPILNIGF